jgi:ArsR family transcriptional regulator, arsenate/arsenite/antimonite-responsive transcriptional repressor
MPSTVSPIRVSSQDVEDGFVAVFGALSEPIRLQMVRMMIEHGAEEFPCTTFDEVLPIAKSTISYHVQVLRRANLISVRKEGRKYFYKLRVETLEGFAPALLWHLRSQVAAAA